MPRPCPGRPIQRVPRVPCRTGLAAGLRADRDRDHPHQDGLPFGFVRVASVERWRGTGRSKKRSTSGKRSSTALRNEPTGDRRGDIWRASLDPTQEGEIKKTRPCLVLTHDMLNRMRRTVAVIPLSTAVRGCQVQGMRSSWVGHRAGTRISWLGPAVPQANRLKGHPAGPKHKIPPLSQTQSCALNLAPRGCFPFALERESLLVPGETGDSYRTHRAMGGLPAHVPLHRNAPPSRSRSAPRPPISHNPSCHNLVTKKTEKKP